MIISAQPTVFLSRADGVRIAYRHFAGDGPLLIFLPGYMSDMQGSKAMALADWATANGHACLLLDYSGCGQSEGDFADASFEIWRDDVLAVLDHVGAKNVVLVGSSMGGWLMLLVALQLGTRVKGMIGIAPAPDFTDWGFTDDQRATIIRDGVIFQDNPYGPEPTPTYRKLFASGQANRMLNTDIAIQCPVRLLHGQKDSDVPWQISTKLARALTSDDVQITLIKDGDHRLSRTQDIKLLLQAVAELIDQSR